MNRLISVIIMCAFFAAPVVHAKLFKWVDETGQVHYGDSIPPQYQKKEHKELSDEGLTLKTKKAMPTAQQLEIQRVQLAEQKKKEKLVKEQRQRDRVLLDTYTTERDLIAALDARIEAVDSQIQLSQSIIADAQNKLDSSEKLVESLKAQGRKVPPTLYEKIKGEKKSLAINKRVADGHIDKRAKISEQFEGYIARFRELKAEQKRKHDAIVAKRKAAEDALGY
jgi:hypothetical protein